MSERRCRLGCCSALEKRSGKSSFSLRRIRNVSALWAVLPTLVVISSQAILDVMVNLQFTLVETLWKSFWRFSEAESLSL